MSGLRDSFECSTHRQYSIHPHDGKYKRYDSSNGSQTDVLVVRIEEAQMRP